jgi:hypothetical protein
MPSRIEGRVSLALQAYTSHQLPSLRATADAYDVPFETLRERHLGVLPRAQTLANSRKLNNVPVGEVNHPQKLTTFLISNFKKGVSNSLTL